MFLLELQSADFEGVLRAEWSYGGGDRYGLIKAR